MKLLHFILLFFIALTSCNESVKTPDVSISGLNKIEQSRYEPTVKMVDLLFHNSGKDTLYIEKVENVIVSIRDNLDSTQAATLVIPREYKEEINVIVSEMPPPVLFTDSAANLDEYYKQYVLPNKNLASKKLNNNYYWVINPLSSITIKTILNFSLQELAEINSDKLSQSTTPLIMALKVKYYKENTSVSHSAIMTYTGTSDQLLKLVN